MPKISVPWLRDSGNHFGERQPDGQRRQQKDEAGDRTGNADIEQRALGVNRRSHVDEGAERSQQRRRQEDTAGWRPRVVHRRQIVAELVRQQDGQQRQRERQPLQQRGGMVPEPRIRTQVKARSTSNGRLRSKSICMAAPTAVVVSSVTREQQTVQPVAFARARYWPERSATLPCRLSA